MTHQHFFGVRSANNNIFVIFRNDSKLQLPFAERFESLRKTNASIVFQYRTAT